MLTCLPRATLKAPAGVSLVMVEPPPTVPPCPIVTGCLALAQRLFTSDANVRNVKDFFSFKRPHTLKRKVPLAQKIRPKAAIKLVAPFATG